MKKQREEKLGSNNLINRLFKNNIRNKTPSLNVVTEVPLFSSQTSQAYLVPKITKNKLKPIQPDKRLRSKIFSNHDLTLDLDKSDSKIILPSLDVTSRSPAISKVRSKMYSMIDDNHGGDERKKEETEEKPFLTPHDFMEILKYHRFYQESTGRCLKNFVI